MMERISKKSVLGMFKRLEAAYRQPMKGKGDFSFVYSLDYNAIYGGWLVVEIGEFGSESHPFLNKRLPTAKMYDALHMACCALEEFKRGQ